MSKITTGQMFEQWEQMNQKLEALDQKMNGIIDGTTPVPTQLTGSIVDDYYTRIFVEPGTTVILDEFNNDGLDKFRIAMYYTSINELNVTYDATNTQGYYDHNPGTRLFQGKKIEMIEAGSPYTMISDNYPIFGKFWRIRIQNTGTDTTREARTVHVRRMT